MAYFSNSSEGDVLDNQCAECMIPDDAPCPVLYVQMTYNYDQIGKGKGRKMLRKAINNLVDKDGQCQMKKVLDDIPPVYGEEKDAARKALDEMN